MFLISRKGYRRCSLHHCTGGATWLLPLHELMQRWARGGRVTSRGFRHIILRHTWEEGTRWSRHHLAIRRGVDDTRSIRDMGASTKRKENQSSSNSGRKQKTSIPLGISRMGRRLSGAKAALGPLARRGR